MKHIISLLTCILILLLGAGGCRVSDVREFTVVVPAMRSEQEVDAIRKALARLEGVKLDKSHFDPQKGEIRVVYESMVVAHKNVEIAIAELGYDANEVKAIKRE